MPIPQLPWTLLRAAAVGARGSTMGGGLAERPALGVTAGIFLGERLLFLVARTIKSMCPLVILCDSHMIANVVHVTATLGILRLLF